MHSDGPEIRINAKQLPKSQQTSLGTLIAGRPGERRTAYGAEQHGVGVSDGICGRGRKRYAGLLDTSCPDGVLGGLNPAAVEIGGGPQYLDGLGGDLRTDSVPRQNCDGERSHQPGSVCRTARRASNAAMSGSSRSVLPISSRPESNISRR